MKLKGIEIKPGMVITARSYSEGTLTWVAFPIRTGEGIGFVNLERGAWSTGGSLGDIQCIRGLCDEHSIVSGEILWDKSKEIVTLSMQEVAEKLGVDVALLRIKK